jgi:hypothetical protein
LANCTHLDQIRVGRPEEVGGCEECLKTASEDWSCCYEVALVV